MAQSSKNTCFSQDNDSQVKSTQANSSQASDGKVSRYISNGYISHGYSFEPEMNCRICNEPIDFFAYFVPVPALNKFRVVFIYGGYYPHENCRNCSSGLFIKKWVKWTNNSHGFYVKEWLIGSCITHDCDSDDRYVWRTKYFYFFLFIFIYFYFFF